MARIRETLRQASPVVERSTAGEVPPVVEIPDSMPFIEVGARRHFEASPEVLAAMSVQPGVRTGSNEQAVARPHNVLLRAVPPSPSQSQATPRGRLASELVAYHAPGQPASARYSDLLTALLEAGQIKAGAACRSVLLTSARSGIGATTVLLNLAISAARQGKRVVVVDANLRRPAIAERLGLPPSPGLTEVLSGELRLSEALQPTAQDNLLMLACGQPTAILADEPSVRGLVYDLVAEHDLVLIDGPRIEQPLPTIGRSWEGRAVWLLASVCQAMYMVVSSAEADTASTQDLATSLTARALPLAGCIVAG